MLRALERFERADDGGQFHPVVGGVRFAAPEFLLPRTGLQENAPAAGAGVATTAAVGVDIQAGFIDHVVRFPFG